MPKRKPKDPNRNVDLPHEWIERHLSRMAEFLYMRPLELTEWGYKRGRLIGPGQYEEIDTEWGTIQLGEQWGGPDVTGYFEKTIALTEAYVGADTVLDIDLDGGETQLSINGRPWQGLDFYRSIVPLGEFASRPQELQLEMEAFIINYPYDERRHDQRDWHTFKKARLAVIDRDVEAFLHDAHFVYDAYMSYYHDDSNLELEGFLLHHLEEACRAMGPMLVSQEEAREAAVRARAVLRDGVFNSTTYRREGQITVAAHSHMDIVYLWPLKETLRKNCRSITNMLSLMREFPEYQFSYSQPYLYETLKEMYPAVYAEVKERIKEGRWEVIGGMYVEPDGNLLGAESVVRQILLGKRFIRDEFGLEAETCWLPDVFGVMYTLPQILRKSGIKYFSTAKLNIWNDTNPFPYDSFRWRGPDGSEVVTHFSPTHFAQDYRVANLRRHWQDFREKQTVGENLFIYGWGDGGGGPTREMVASSLRSTDFPGLPKNQIGRTEDFFHRLEAKADKLPVWDDELYLETHRGTYTSKADLKRFNRKAELLYRDVEILSAMAFLVGGSRIQERLTEGWKLILFNQFHDILPGSHVPAAIPDTRQDYARVFEIGREIRGELLAHLVSALSDNATSQNDVMVLNTLGWQVNGLVAIDGHEGVTAVRLPDGSGRPVQYYADQMWLHLPEVPSLGWVTAAFETQSAENEPDVATFTDGVIGTRRYTIAFDEDGNIGRLYDKANDREVLTGAGNAFQMFEDDPGKKFGAWDVAYHLEEYAYPVTQTKAWEMVANGPLFAVFTAEWTLLTSSIRQEMWLYAHSGRIDFKTEVIWRDQKKMLKVAFPLNVRTRRATYDLPFGHIERATHRNTSWEQAKYEVCGHKWADLSEGDYGVALLNDCKYGYDARENVLRLSLVRSPVRPDPFSDIGEHQFTYSLLPHAGDWRQGQVDRQAYELNVPLVTAAIATDRDGALAEGLAQRGSILEVASPSVIVEAVKQAEDGNGLIVRTFDSHGTHGKAAFQASTPLTTVAETDLLEENPEIVAVDDATAFTVRYRPYEIKTHRLVWGASTG